MSDLVALIAQFAADDQIDFHQRARRDRSIGRELAPLETNPVAQLRGWLARVASAETMRRGDVATRGRRLIGATLFALGLLLGWGAALTVFHYDGSRPVSVTNVLIVFVGLQLVMLAVFAIMCLPAAVLRFAPGGAGGALSVLNPGRWGMWLSRYLPAAQRESLGALLVDDAGSARTLGPVRRWYLARWSQGFAVAFNAGALASALYLVTVSDLAFGWSTTLDVGSETFHSFVRGLAAPWRAWLPQAVPSLDLVDATRYFRMDSGLLPNAVQGSDPALMGTWWPFLAMCMVSYGLAPRVLTWAYSAVCSSRSTRRAMIRIPGAAELLERLNTPIIETASTQPETHAAGAGASNPGERTHPIGSRHIVIDWASAVEGNSEFGARLGVVPGTVHTAGGTRSLEADAELIAQLGQEKGSDTIVIFVKAWEPPLLDFMDFVTALRSAVGERRRIAVVPVAQQSADQALSPRADDLDTWNIQIARLEDPGTFMHRFSD